MKEPHIIHQTWPFTCLTCRHTWESAYEAWHVDDGRGGQVTTWRHRGMASTPPWAEPACPACGGLHVKTLPPGAKPRTGGRAAGPRPPEARRPADAGSPAPDTEGETRDTRDPASRKASPKVRPWPHRATGNASGR